MLVKTEGHLRIRNLRNAKIVLIAKNIFIALNFDDKFWIQIMHVKYEKFNI